MRAICVDVDDVLAQTVQTLLGLLEERFGRRLSLDQVTTFDLGVSFSLRGAELDAFMAAAHEPDVIERYAPVEGAAEVLRHWMEAGYRVDLVTGRPPSARDSTLRWLERVRIPYHSVECVDKYGRHPDAELDLEHLCRRDYALVVEDSLEVAARLARRATVALLDRPWNRDTAALSEPSRSRIRRVASWDEIRSLFPHP